MPITSAPVSTLLSASSLAGMQQALALAPRTISGDLAVSDVPAGTSALIKDVSGNTVLVTNIGGTLYSQRIERHLTARATLWLDAVRNAGVSPTPNQITALDEFFTGMETGGFAAGVVSMILPVWNVAAANLINLFNPATPIAGTGGLTHTSRRLQSDGTTGYVNLVPGGTTAAGIGFSNFWLAANVAPGFTESDGYLISGSVTGPSYLSLQLLDSTSDRYLTTGASTLTGLDTDDDLSGTTVAYQGSVNRGVVGIIDGTETIIANHVSAVSATASNPTIFGFANSANGVASDFSTLPARCLAVGKQSLTSAKAEELATLINTLVAAVTA